ncbi:MAG: TetR/AcrR family transcriptional regulator [Burkholderiaceae bacterium]
MPTSTPKKKAATKKATNPRQAYHHGNLREAMIEATLALVEEGGPENVSLREAAKRAGVSSGAPFRHFPNRTALMTAVAEEAMHRLRAGIVDALDKSVNSDPLMRFRAVGYAYLKWAVHNPAHLLVISDRRLIDFDRSESLQKDNEHIQQLMSDLLEDADARGILRAGDRNSIPLIAKALSYGLARMYIDGHMPQWGVKQGEVIRTMEAAIDQFIDGIASDAWLKFHKRTMRSRTR